MITKEELEMAERYLEIQKQILEIKEKLAALDNHLPQYVPYPVYPAYPLYPTTPAPQRWWGDVWVTCGDSVDPRVSPITSGTFM